MISVLVHYTHDINSASSILNSGEFWFKKMKYTKDEHEIFHYNKELGRTVYTLDLVKMAHISLREMEKEPQRSQTILEEFLVKAVHYQQNYSNTSISGVLAEFLRENSYLACFTQTENDFHTTEYGGIGFVFESNPFEPSGFSRRFKLIEEKVMYFDANKINNLQQEHSEFIINKLFATDQSSNVLTFMRKCIRQLEKGFKSYESVLKELMRDGKKTADLDFQKLIQNDLEMKEIINFLNREVSILRSREYSKLGATRSKSKKEIAEKNRKVENIAPALGSNLITCFMKDNRFQPDNETRILALPKNRRALDNPSDSHLPISFNRRMLKKIVVDSNKKEEDIYKLKELLSELNMNHVEVI